MSEPEKDIFEGVEEVEEVRVGGKKRLVGVKVRLFRGDLRKAHGCQYFGKNYAVYVISVPAETVKVFIGSEEVYSHDVHMANMYVLSERTCNKVEVERVVGASKKWLAEHMGIHYVKTPLIRYDSPFSKKAIEELYEGRFRDVKPLDVFMRIRRALKMYIEFYEPRAATYLALWIMGTYFYKMFDAYPYVYLGGTKRSGKTKTLSVIGKLAWNPVFSCDMSTASLFRCVDAWSSTVLIDEVEALSTPERRRDLRRLLNAGYKKESGMVYRVEGDRVKYPAVYCVYGPKALANIEGLEEVLEDRTVFFTMARGLNKEIMSRAVEDTPFLQRIRDDMLHLAVTKWHKLMNVLNELKAKGNPYVGKGIYGREWELWQPVIALALWIGRSEGLDDEANFILKIVEELMLRKTEERKAEEWAESKDTLLLKALCRLVNKDRWYNCDEIIDELNKLYEEDVGPGARIRWTKQWLGWAMKRFGYKGKKKKVIGGKTHYYVTVDSVRTLAERFEIDYEEIKAEEPVRLPKPVQGVCPICGKSGDLVYSINGEIVCEVCARDLGAD